jgi:hypothetical protein
LQTKQRRLIEYMARVVPSLYAAYPEPTSLVTRVLSVVETVYFGTMGACVQLTLAGVGVHALVGRAIARRRRAGKDKLFKY